MIDVKSILMLLLHLYSYYSLNTLGCTFAKSCYTNKLMAIIIKGALYSFGEDI